MIEEIRSDLFRIEVTLPKNPLKLLNAYLIKGQKRNLLIDTGFNRQECLEDLTNGLSEIGISMAETDFFLTHQHADHSGLVLELAGPDSRIYCSEADGKILNMNLSSSRWHEVELMMYKHGFPAEKIKVMADIHPAKKYAPMKEIPFTFVSDGESLEVGDYHLNCIFTPGHTPGHMCIYDPEHKILFSGDHILGDITPNISKWLELEDSLGQYLASLDRVANLDAVLILPGHRRRVESLEQRINELELHHDQRLNEQIDILAHGPLHAYQVAGKMKWDLTYQSWDEVAVTQQWFAAGEAIAHLDHLAALNKVRCIEKDGLLYFELI